MKISVVIPLYNKAKYIERALKSVLSQTYQDFEVVVVDDGSTDGSGDVVKSIEDNRIKLVHQENAGVSAARNKGIELSNAELIAFLDADDEWEPWFLETILKSVNDYPDAGIYGTAYKYITSNSIIINPIFPNVEDGVMKNYFKTPYICSSSVVLNKNKLIEVGGFPKDIIFGEDFDTWIRVATRYPIVWSTKTSATINITFNSASHNEILWIGDTPFAEYINNVKEHMESDKWYSLFELLCSQRLRFYAIGTYLGGQKRLARRMVLACSQTRENRRIYYFLLVLTQIPIPISKLLYRIWKKNWKPLRFSYVNRKNVI